MVKRKINFVLTKKKMNSFHYQYILGNNFTKHKDQFVDHNFIWFQDNVYIYMSIPIPNLLSEKILKFSTFQLNLFDFHHLENL